MAPKDRVELGTYSITFVALREFNGPNYRASEGQFEIKHGTDLVAELRPQKRFYQVRQAAMTEAGIAPGFTRDLYISLGEPLGDGGWSVRLHVKAFVRWLWLGALMMAAGGTLAISDRRFRSSAAERASASRTAGVSP